MTTTDVTRRWPDSTVGRASRINERTTVSGTGGGAAGGPVQVSSLTTVRFRLEPLDGGSPLWVRLRGRVVDGLIEDGDVVEVRGTRRGAEIRSHEVYDHTSGDTLVVRYRRLQLVLGLILAVVVLSIIAFVVVGALTDKPARSTPPSGFPGGPPATHPSVIPSPDQLRSQSMDECLHAGFTQAQCEQVVDGTNQ